MKLLFCAVLFLYIGIHVDAHLEEKTSASDSASTPGESAEEIIYVSPVPKGHIYFAEHFDSPDDFEAKWIRSQAKKDGADEEIAKYDGKIIVDEL